MTIVQPLIHNKWLTKEHCSPWEGNDHDISSYMKNE